jgi:hypothetical protein
MRVCARVIPPYDADVLSLIQVLAEGCADVMSENLAPLLEFVYRGFSDPSQKVREAACICIGQFAGTRTTPQVDL